jgi:hypothetical protein
MSGFAMENGKPNELIKVLCRWFGTSDDKDFFTYIESIENLYLSNVGILEEYIHNFLIIHHEDLSVDIYINDLPIKIEFLSKRNVQKGEIVYENDVADIRQLKFNDIEIKESDNIIFCFKQGWRFGLFFDLTYNGQPNSKMNIERLYYDLGTYYKKLRYYYLYKTIENGEHFEEMKKDGWFPYVELLSSDYKELSNAYHNKFIFQANIEKLFSKFSKERVEKIVDRWWKNPLYLNKKALLQAGIDGYLRNTQEGFISAIKILYSEIEGILGLLFLSENEKYTNKSAELLQFIKEKGQKRTAGYESILLPDIFCSFLQESFFPQFDLLKGDVALSRHTSSHGVAGEGTYTKARALQAILILDQIYFFIPPLNEK